MFSLLGSTAQSTRLLVSPYQVRAYNCDLHSVVPPRIEESKTTRNGQTGYNPRSDYTDPWSTNLASYLLDALPASGIAEDKRDCWESRQLGFFSPFCERMWCGTWFWPDLVSLVSISKVFFSPETTGGGWLIVQLWRRKIVWSC